jgi:hypothetical protein
MAATVLGLTLTFGVPTIANLVVQSRSFTEAVSMAEVPDEDGDVVSVGLYGRKVTGTVEAFDNTFVTVIGTLTTLTGAPTGNFYLTQKAETLPNTNFKRRTLQYTAWAGI